MYNIGMIHPLLKSYSANMQDVSRIPIRLKIVTGTYILQTPRVKYSNDTAVSPLCTLWHKTSNTLCCHVMPYKRSGLAIMFFCIFVLFFPSFPIDHISSKHLEIARVISFSVLMDCCLSGHLFHVFFSSPGQRPCELLSWVSVRRNDHSCKVTIQLT
jgi:hypothetical protein